MMKNTIGDFKLSGDARGLTNAVSLAKLRAASDFSRRGCIVDLTIARITSKCGRKPLCRLTG